MENKDLQKTALLKLATDRHEASRGLSATAGQLVAYLQWAVIDW